MTDADETLRWHEPLGGSLVKKELTRRKIRTSKPEKEEVVFILPDQANLQHVLKLRGTARVGLQPSIGLLSVMTAVHNAGHHVVLYDNYLERLPYWDLADKILHENSDCKIFAYSLNCLNIFEAKNILAHIDRNLKRHGVIHIAGGPHVTLCPRDCDEWTYKIRGDGEIEMVALLEAFEQIGDGRYGLCRVRDAGRIYDLDSLPIPNRDLIHGTRYDRQATNMPGERVENMITSRGCNWNCRFCNTSEIWDPRYVHRSALNVIKEIRYLKEHCGATGIFFREDTFTGNSKRILALRDEFVKPENSDLHDLVFQSYARVKPLSDKVLDALAEMNFESLFIGFESGNDRVLREIRKGYTVSDAFNCIERIRSRGIKYGAGFIFGFPNETQEEIEETRNMAKMDEHGYVYFQRYCGYPTSEIYQQCQKEGLVIERYGTVFSSRTHHVDGDVLRFYEESFPRNKYFPDKPWRR